MTEDEDSEEPAVTLGTQRTVEGAPLARVSARLMWGIGKSAVEKREGETVIRTPDGPRELSRLLTDVDKRYFATRQEFETALSEVTGSGAIPTEGDSPDEGSDAEPGSDLEQTESGDEEGTNEGDESESENKESETTAASEDTETGTGS